MINNVLIGQHEKWIQNSYSRQLKQSSQGGAKDTVFDRINIYQLYMDFKTKLLKDI